MRQAIITQYRGPTHKLSARIHVRAEAGRMTVPWDSAFGIDHNHIQAAKAFAQKYGWKGKWHGGAYRDSFMFVAEEKPYGFAWLDGFTVD